MIGSMLRVAAPNAVARSHQLQLAGRQIIQKRNGGPWYYRTMPPHNKRQERMSQYMMCAVWAWVTYHCCTDYGHLIGHYNVPPLSSLTDEELGVIRD